MGEWKGRGNAYWIVHILVCIVESERCLRTRICGAIVGLLLVVGGILFPAGV